MGLYVPLHYLRHQRIDFKHVGIIHHFAVKLCISSHKNGDG